MEPRLDIIYDWSIDKSNEDCFYFLTSNCAKGPSCPYRHNPTVLTCNVICPAWLRGNCTDPACPLRHSAVQRPTISSGITCFYENTPMGCLKLDCTFVHLRPRPNLRNSSTPRPSTTNLVNKDAIKPTTVTNSPTSTINESIPSPQIIPPTPAPKIETPEIPPPIIKTETPIPVESEQKVTTDSSDDTKTTSSRVVVNRNVVIAESASIPNRKVVQATSNRVVVSSKKPTHDSDSDLDDLFEQENDTNKSNSIVDITFPCSVPSITNRLFMSSKPSTPTNDTKPIRLNRDRLPAAKITISNSIPAPSNGEKTSAGTGLSQADDRRTSRIERFKKKPISPPRSVVNSSSSIPTRNVINSSPNERKRPAPEQSINDSSPPTKRLSSQQEINHHHNSATIGDLCSPPSSPRRTHNRHHRRRRSSRSPSRSRSRSRSRSPSSSSSPSPPPLQRKSPRQTFSSTSSMNESAWKRSVDEFLAKTTQPKITVSPKPVPLLSLRPRYIPPPVPQQPMIRHHRPRQPSTVAIKRPLAPVITPPSKPIEQVPPNNVTPAPSSPILSNEDEENQLLQLDEPTDVVDTFALIDEALFETDQFLELM